MFLCEPSLGASSSAEKAAQTAVTTDGRTVVLKADGTWEYAKSPGSGSGTRHTMSTISIEAGLVYQSGDVKPVARTTFYLMDNQTSNILRDANVKPQATTSLGSAGIEAGTPEFTFGVDLAHGAKDSPNEEPGFFGAAMEAIRPHIIQTVTTAFSGKASFKPVPTKTYYIMGAKATPNGFAMWDLRVDLKPGQNSIILDQNNAIEAD